MKRRLVNLLISIERIEKDFEVILSEVEDEYDPCVEYLRRAINDMQHAGDYANSALDEYGEYNRG